MFVGAGIWCIPSNRGGHLDTVSLYWISLFLWFDYATSPTKRYRPLLIMEKRVTSIYMIMLGILSKFVKNQCRLIFCRIPVLVG